MVILSCPRMLWFIVFGVSAALALSSCSISDSVGSISDSSGSFANSSESISDSSTSSSKDSDKHSKKSDDMRYENEIKDFTVTYIRTNTSQIDQSRQANHGEFMRGISDIAAQKGIVDWEANPKTYRGIGKGLRKAKVTGVLYDFYRRDLANGDRGKMEDIQEGYWSKD